MKANLVQLENTVWVAEAKTGVATYDFSFENFFACRHAWKLDGEITAVARMGAAQDYDARYAEFLDIGVRLVHTPAEYSLTSHLPEWYPVLEGITPRSKWYDELPTARQIEESFDWPVFIKGERQTNKHSRRQSIIEDAEHFTQLMSEWRRESILAWQRVVCREYVPLRCVSGASGDSMPKSFEFRTFWWKTQCVGVGRYWVSESYEASDDDIKAIIRTAGEAVERLGVTFPVIDVAQTAEGKWIVIECNDGQDFGYSGVHPMMMWRKVVQYAGQ